MGAPDPAGDVSAGRWRGYFTDFLVILEGTRWCVHHTVVELSVERLSGVLGGVAVAREKGEPCSVRVCGGRQVEQQRNGHWQLDRQMPPTSAEPHWTSGSARRALSS